MDDEAKHIVEISKVAAYTGLLVDDGYDSLDALTTLELDDLTAMGMKKGHAKVFLRNIRRSCAPQPERAVCISDLMEPSPSRESRTSLDRSVYSEARERRKKDPNKAGGFVEYTRPVDLPWRESDPHVELQCEWYRSWSKARRGGRDKFVLGNVQVDDNDWIHVSNVCAPVVITYCSGTEKFNPRLYELDEASK